MPSASHNNVVRRMGRTLMTAGGLNGRCPGCAVRFSGTGPSYRGGETQKSPAGRTGGAFYGDAGCLLLHQAHRAGLVGRGQAQQVGTDGQLLLQALGTGRERVRGGARAGDGLWVSPVGGVGKRPRTGARIYLLA
ncbi:hypothetical protein GCM10028821_12770 [Hymenobacter jeollabukensis]